MLGLIFLEYIHLPETEKAVLSLLRPCVSLLLVIALRLAYWSTAKHPFALRRRA